MNKILAKKINILAKKDQIMRQRAMHNHKYWNPQIDRQNTKALKKIISKYGWPDNKLVGKKGAINSWLLAQHADYDLSFQKRCLKLAREKANKNLIPLKCLAYLTDRVLVHEKKKQLYGTQFYQTKSGALKERQIANKKGLAKRRKQMGLEPFLIYKKRIADR